MRSRDAALLGAVQGVAEFLPVSSSAHLLLLRRMLGEHDASRAFEVALHVATTASLLTADGSALLAPPASLLDDVSKHRTNWSRYAPASRLALRLALATLPSVALGGVFGRRIARIGDQPGPIAALLLVGAAGMLAAERRRGRLGAVAPEEVSTAAALTIGVAQAAALLPGVSRSGATIAAALALGLDRPSAARFSILLPAPVMTAAAVRTLPDGPRLLRRTGARPLLVASLAAWSTGLMGIWLLRRTAPRYGLGPFVWYRCALAAAVLLGGRAPGGSSRRPG